MNPLDLIILAELRDTALGSADFLNLTMPAVKLMGGEIADAEKAMLQSFTFAASVTTSIHSVGPVASAKSKNRSASRRRRRLAAARLPRMRASRFALNLSQSSMEPFARLQRSVCAARLLFLPPLRSFSCPSVTTCSPRAALQCKRAKGGCSSFSALRAP
mgnify:CR=1 FL=1